MKLLCVLLPHFPLSCEAQRHPDIQSCPAVITYAVGSQKLVLDFSPELKDIQSGMPLQQALSLNGEVKVIYADIPHYWFIFNHILDSLEGKSPLVEGSGLGCAYIGLDGMQLIYPDDNAVVNNIKKAIPGPFAVQMGIAKGKFLAYLAGLYSSPSCYRTLTSDVASFLSEISCDVLPISIKSKNKLRDFGIRTLGQISPLPPGPLQSQFGPEGKRIWELARGYDDTPLCPRFTEEVIEESTVLPSMTVSLEAILMIAESLLSRAFARGSLKGRGIRSLTFWTRRWGSGHWEQNIRFKEPAVDIKSVVSRLKQVLENCSQPGPVEQLGMRLTGLGYRSGRQKSLFSEVRARDHLLEDIKQLDLRLGSPQVYKIKEVEPWSRIPERRYALTPLSR